MSLKFLFEEVAHALDGPEEIERHGREALLGASPPGEVGGSTDLPQAVLTQMRAPDAHPVCDRIARTPLPWAPPGTSSDPKYIADSVFKMHVELLGPGGLAHSDKVRLGLYGMLPNSEYGLRTHPAEEIYVMLAGACDWHRGDAPYQTHGPGERSYHPSMLPHATRTTEKTFMSIYIWHGDLSTENYVYTG